MRYVTILCGGSGSRLWPASRRSRPKQFLDVLGCGETLLQLAAARAIACVSRDNVLAVVNKDHRDLVCEQLPWLPESNILAEPARRGTAPAILWAARVAAVRDPDASMAIMPANHLVVRTDNFVKAINAGFEYVEKNGSILAIAVVPPAPRKGCTHIQKGKQIEGEENIYEIQTIAGKPDDALAKVFFDSEEFLIHTGILIFRAAEICRLYRRLAPDLWELSEKCLALDDASRMESIERAYSEAASRSIADALLENLKGMKVMAADIGWSNLADWDALYQASPKHRGGNVARNALIYAPDCHGTIFSSDSEKLIMAYGLKDLIVADTRDALLICPREKEAALRDTIKSLRSSFGEKFT